MYIYHISMNEWVKRYTCEFPYKHSVFTAPDKHMPYISQLYIMRICNSDILQNKTVKLIHDARLLTAKNICSTSKMKRM